MKTEKGPLILAIGKSLVISKAVLGYGGARGGQKLNRRRGEIREDRFYSHLFKKIS